MGDDWLGHGYFWKASDSDTRFNDIGALDFDALEGGFCKLKRARALYVDYPQLRLDMHLDASMTEAQLDDWIVEHAAYISEGQVRRIRPGGDLHEWMEPVEIEEFVDLAEEKKRSGLRMKGGGRAATLFSDDEYSFADGRVEARMVDVKGVGTSVIHQDLQIKACGFLSAIDAFKELAFQRLLQRISEISNQKSDIKWGTVRYLAIIDTGLKFKQGVVNPATGYEGDRCVLAIR